MERFADRQDALDAAKLRATIQTARAGGSPARLQGRRTEMLPQLTALPSAADPYISLLKSNDQRERIFDSAAALFLGNDIAQVVTPLARARLIEAIGADARRSAVQNRSLGRIPNLRATVNEDASDLVDDLIIAFKDARENVTHIWANRLPAPLDKEMRPKAAPTLADPLSTQQLQRCLDAAMPKVS